MMIEIKFRGVNRQTNKWRFGDLTQEIDGKRLYEAINGEEIIAETRGQFTGLIDNSEEKEEIYGGDIIEDKFGRKYVVKYFSEWGAYMFYMPDDSNTNVLNPLRITAIDNFELIVVGNIIDNPELLEVK